VTEDEYLTGGKAIGVRETCLKTGCLSKGNHFRDVEAYEKKSSVSSGYGNMWA
jgi:hypothetical protein